MQADTYDFHEFSCESPLLEPWEKGIYHDGGKLSVLRDDLAIRGYDYGGQDKLFDNVTEYQTEWRNKRNLALRPKVTLFYLGHSAGIGLWRHTVPPSSSPSGC